MKEITDDAIGYDKLDNEHYQPQLGEEFDSTCACGWTGKGTGPDGAFVHGDRCPVCGEVLA